MLLNLYIRDFGIIESTGMEFARGLNVLSGETGAGKSIIVEALQVVSGGRALTEYIRAGCERAVVQAVFDARDLPGVSRLLSAHGIAGEPDGTLILSREIRIGRNICRINGQAVTLNAYREFGQMLVDIQGQYDQQLLFEPERQLYLLDAYGGEEISAISAEVSRIYGKWRETGRLIDSLREKYREWARRQDTINYQLGEIDGAGLRPGEEEELLSEKKKLANAEKISRLAGDCYRSLHGGDAAASALELIGSSLKDLDRVIEMDSGLSGVREMVAAALYQIEEACRELAAYLDGIEFYPARLEFVEERLDILARLKKKYGATVADILRYRAEIAGELQEMEGGEQKIDQLERELASLSGQLADWAGKLTEKRRLAAAALERDIAGELQELEMGKVKFTINFADREAISEKGRERAEFYISTNPGEPVRPLSKIASGGETSRLMLAVKSILAGIEEIPTLVFDELDTGIGGRTIRSVAIKLHNLSRQRQIICVSHSPAVASMADNHLLIRKGEAQGRTKTEVSALSDEERLEELARMLGGSEKGGAVLDHARQLLEEADKLKSM
ncbi:MAG: DNA repair protein RecN [Peptococcaceae bacterium]|nr:DNA repair protein RecN [Peptococcaceae bacterium]